MEINDENRGQIIEALSSQGFKILNQEDEAKYKESYETLKNSESKELWDKIDNTIHEMTGIEKLIRDDGGRERTVNYYQRALKESLEGKKNASKELETYKKSLEEAQSQLEAYKSENPEAKYEETFKKLKSELKAKEEEYNNKLSERDNQFKQQLFNNELNSVFNAIRGQLKTDTPYLEDVIENKKRMISSLESKTQENGQTVFYENGQPLLTEDGNFMSIADIAKRELINLFDESKAKQGLGNQGQKNNNSVKTYSSKAELEKALKEKYHGKVGSPEWLAERKAALEASGLK